MQFTDYAQSLMLGAKALEEGASAMGEADDRENAREHARRIRAVAARLPEYENKQKRIDELVHLVAELQQVLHGNEPRKPTTDKARRRGPA